MELRSCTHLHFVQTVKSGLVMKVVNINSYGKPALTFKKVNDIYESIDAKTDDSLSKFLSNDRLGERHKQTVKIESPSVHYAERKLIKAKPGDPKFNCSTGDGDSTNIDTDESNFGNMTLKQIKERCKQRKRKHLEYVRSCTETVKTWSSLETNHYDSQPKKNDNDLEMPLCLLRSKLFKQKKAKINCKRTDDSILSQLALAIVKSEERCSDQDFPPPSPELSAPVEKSETPEPYTTSWLNLNYISDRLSWVCDENVGSYGNIDIAGTNSVLESGLSTSSSDEIPSCTVSKSDNEYVEYPEPEPLQIVWDSVEDSEKADTLRINSLWFPDSPASEYIQQGFPIHSAACDVNSETISSTEDQSSDTYFSQEPSHGDDVCVTEHGSEDALLSSSESSVTKIPNDDCVLVLDDCLVSVINNSSPAKDDQFQISICSDREEIESSSPSTCVGDEFIPSVENQCHQHPEFVCPAQRLLSTRTAISPKSQKKLCQAMESIKLHDNQSNICRGELGSVKQSQNKVQMAEGHDRIRRAEFDITPQQIFRKSENKSVHSKGSRKVTHHSRAAAQVSTGFNSVQSCTQSAIAFTERQMQDIECVAMKLTNQLKSMKAIVEERLDFAVDRSSLKYNDDEVRMAIGDANKVEEYANRWLSIMARDCNRFCKIMRMTEKDSSVSVNEVHQKRKKITFADEAGGNLCQVRVITDDTTSAEI